MRLSELLLIPFPNSLAWLFTHVTSLLGFSFRTSEQKTAFCEAVYLGGIPNWGIPGLGPVISAAEKLVKPKSLLLAMVPF